MTKTNIFIRYIKSLGIAFLWALLLLLVSWVYSHCANLYGLDIIMFFVVLLIDLFGLIILIGQLDLFGKIKAEKNAVRKNMVIPSILYGIVGFVFGVVSYVLILAGHVLIYLIGGLAFVANKAMFGPYDIMLMIMFVFILVAYVASGIKEGIVRSL